MTRLLYDCILKSQKTSKKRTSMFLLLYPEKFVSFVHLIIYAYVSLSFYGYHLLFIKITFSCSIVFCVVYVSKPRQIFILYNSFLFILMIINTFDISRCE